MSAKLCFGIFLLALLKLTRCKAEENTNDLYNCPRSLDVLEKALYETEENRINLTRTFYPPRQLPTGFVRVYFNFVDDEIGNCTVTYYWATGGFLFIEPPAILRLASLFLNNEVDNITELYLVLPKECRPLVDPDCTCIRGQNNVLDLLTQRLKLYAKYDNYDSIVQDDTTMVQAVCKENLKSYYYENNFVIGRSTSIFLLFTVFIPIICIAVSITFIRSVRKDIHTKLTSPANYGTISAIVITGFIIALFVTILDVVSALLLYYDKTEIESDLDIKKSFNYIIVIVLSIYDGVILIISSSVLFYICCIELNCCCSYEKCPECIGKATQCCFSGLFYLIFGITNQKKSWYEAGINATTSENDNTSNQDITDTNDYQVKVVFKTIKENRLKWVLMFSSIAPMFTLSGHFSFMLMSWLIDPSAATAIAILGITIIMYLFIIIKQCYNINRKYSAICSWCYDWGCQGGLMFCPLWDIVYGIYKTIMYICFGTYCQKIFNRMTCSDENLDLNQELLPVTGYDFKTESDGRILKPQLSQTLEFDSKSFCVTFGWTFIIIIPVIFALIAFWELPISTLSLPNYVLNLFQIFVVVISLLLTYKIVSAGEPEVKRFLQNMRLAYTNESGEDNKIKKWAKFDDVEALGDLAGKVAYKYLPCNTDTTRNAGNNNGRDSRA